MSDSTNKQDEWFDVLFVHFPQPMWIYDRDTLAFLEVNQAAISEYGYTRDEFLSMTLADIRPPEDVPALKANVEATEEGYSQAGIWRHLMKDGTLRRVNISSRTLDYNGHRAELIQVQNVTEQLQLQIAALQAAANAIVITNRDGLIEWCNQAFLDKTGYLESEVVHKAPEDIIKSNKHPAAFYQRLWDTILSGNVWQGEITNRTKDGQLYLEDMTITPIKNDKGDITHFVAVKQDITERRKLEEQVARSQRLDSIGTLAGGIAHDMNNVLAPILMSGEILQDADLSESEREDLETIIQSARRGSDLVRQILLFARGDSGERESVQVQTLVQDMLLILRETFPKNIDIETHVSDTLWPIYADVTHVHQILMNLCLNARDAMPDGGLLEISIENHPEGEMFDETSDTETYKPHIVLAIQDSGIGMPSDIQKQIFDPFYTTKPKGKGTGLGLSTVATLVRSLGGAINVYSEPGNGTTFRVYLPALAGQKAEETSDEESRGIPAGQGHKVLVVDDEESIRKVCQKMLERHDYQVVCAAHGAEAVKIYAQDPDSIDVVLLDMSMPVMDGAATIVALRALDPNVRIVCSSGHASNGGITRAMGLGIVYFAPKPYTINHLLQLLDQAIQGIPPTPLA